HLDCSIHRHTLHHDYSFRYLSLVVNVATSYSSVLSCQRRPPCSIALAWLRPALLAPSHHSPERLPGGRHEGRRDVREASGAGVRRHREHELLPVPPLRRAYGHLRARGRPGRGRGAGAGLPGRDPHLFSWDPVRPIASLLVNRHPDKPFRRVFRYSLFVSPHPLSPTIASGFQTNTGP
ncbi:hypothetical protein LCGC14_2008940, partial [marine sediment metagenome]